MTEEVQLLRDYQTSHMPLVAYLKMMGNQITDVKADGRRGIFTFKHVPRQQLIDFNTSHARVEPNEFAEKMSQLTQTAKRVTQEYGA